MTGKRPFGVMVIAIAQLLNALSAWILAGIGRESFADFIEAASRYEVASMALGLIGLVITLGLRTSQRWAWVATMLWAGTNMTAALIAYIYGEPQYIQMVLSVIVVFYLNQRDIQLAFQTGIVQEDANVE